LTSKSPDRSAETRLVVVVLFFEILLVAALIAISWFALYTLYRLITEES